MAGYARRHFFAKGQIQGALFPNIRKSLPESIKELNLVIHYAAGVFAGRRSHWKKGALPVTHTKRGDR